jgi:site-specific DNA-adenine methylase
MFYDSIDPATTSQEWYTPPYIFDALGCWFDLDPASPGCDVVPWVPANTHYTTEGLERPWGGFVWLNPPYGRDRLPAWVEKFAEHGNGIILVPERTSTEWWQGLSSRADMILFVNKKIPFISGDGRKAGAAAIGSCLVAIGKAGVAGLRRAHNEGLGRIVRPIKHSVMPETMPTTYPLFYHPGSKFAAAHHILPILAPMLDGADEYRELFVGAGSIAVAVMGLYPQISVWINDGDPAIASLWAATRNTPTRVCQQVLDFHQPSVAAFDLFGRLIKARTEVPKDADARARLGFYQLAWSMMRSGGWGQGPRGGWDQHDPIIGERWSQQYIARKVGTISDRFGGRAKTKITCCDFEPLITDTSRRAVLFLDPPYFGDKNLYRYDFADDDHERLARLLKETPHDWLLIYEEHEAVWELYEGWATIRPLYKARRVHSNPETRKAEKVDTLVISNRRGATGEPPRGMWAAHVAPKVDGAKVAEIIERVRAKVAAKKAGNDAA